MIELLIFYWIFSGLFINGSDTSIPTKNITTFIWFVFFMLIGGIIFPYYLGHLTKKLKL